MKLRKALFALIVITASSSIFASSWECVSRNIAICNTWRMEVPHGWLVSTDNSNEDIAITYYPDPDHEWKG